MSFAYVNFDGVQPPFLGAIDQGTSSTRFILFDSKGKQTVAYQTEFPQIHPHPGWVEHNPLDILSSIEVCVENVAIKLKECGFKMSDIVGVGIANQRETTLVWDKESGKPLYNALVWCDARTASTVNDLIKLAGGDKDKLRSKCGLPISTYFSGVKLRWLVDNVSEVKKGFENGTALAGTIDTWVIWSLTNKKIFITDVTNASRTMLMNITTLKWDKELCDFFEVPVNVLPEIKSSSEVYGKIEVGPLSGISIASCLGDQQSAVVGQLCFEKGEAKNTYGTGCFMLYNTGNEVVHSTHGLLTTVCYKFCDEPAVYALEGSIAVAGSGVTWLKENMGMIKSVSEVEELASSVKDTAGLYFVPAFSGLFAPHWKENARGLLVGLTHHTNRSHIALSLLEAVCFQTREVLDAMKEDSGVALKLLKVDGGMTRNNLLLQIQADILGITVARPTDVETTAFGAAFAAGVALNIWKKDSPPTIKNEGWTYFEPKIGEDVRAEKLSKWKDAVQRTLDWV